MLSSALEYSEIYFIFQYSIVDIVCYLLTVIGGIFWFQLSPGQFLHYQFATRTGLTWLVISGMLYGSGLLLYGFLRRGRLDL